MATVAPLLRICPYPADTTLCLSQRWPNMMNSQLTLTLALAGLAIAAPASAQTAPAAAPVAGNVAVTNPWSRATPPGAQTGALYLTLTSPAGDTLLGASSPAAQSAQLHEIRMDGNVMRMRELPAGLDLPAGQPITLQPGGNHIMLVGLSAPLKRGQTIRVHLTFRHSNPIDLEAKVAGIGAAKPP